MTSESVFAFPRPHGTGQTGMTMRQYYAAHAPACPRWFYSSGQDANDIADQGALARWAWSYADAMLKEE